MLIKHSKFKNTGILFELLVRQITADTLSGKNSEATNILKKGTIKRFGYKGKRFMTDEIPYLEEQLTKGFEDKWQ